MYLVSVYAVYCPYLLLIQFSQSHQLTINSFADIQDGGLSTINEKMIVYDLAKQKQTKESPKIQSQSPQSIFERINLINPISEFPPYREAFQNIQSLKHLKQVIEVQKIKYGRTDINYQLRNFKKDSWQSLTAFCVKCSNKTVTISEAKKMTFIKSNQTGGKFFLKFFDSKHSHTPDKLNKLKIIKEEFHNAPKSMDMTAFLEYMHKKYGLNQKKVKQGIYIYKRQNENFTQVFDLVQKCNAKCWFKKRADQVQYQTNPKQYFFEDKPDIFFIIYNKMYTRFEQVGDVCYIAFLNFRLKKEENSGKEEIHWDIFTMTGLTINYIMEPFCLAFLKQTLKTPQILAQIVTKVFSIYDKQPKVLITPNQPVFDQAITILYQSKAFTGLHLYDPIWQADKIGAQLDRYEDHSLFKNIIFSRTYADYIKSIQIVMQKCQPTAKIRRQLNKIMKNAHKLCFSCIKTYEHIGTIFDYSGNKLIFDSIRQHLFRFVYKRNHTSFPLAQLKYLQINLKTICGPTRNKQQIDNAHLNKSRITFTRGAKTIIMLIKRFIVDVSCSSNYDIKPYQTIVDIPEIKTIRKSFKSNILNAFGQQYGRIYNLVYFQRKITSNQPNSLRVFDIYDKGAKSLFIVAPYPQYQKDGSLDKLIWKCNCLFSFKCGVPCSHQTLACMVSKSSLYQLFKKEYEVVIKYRKAGRPKSTRRNMQK